MLLKLESAINRLMDWVGALASILLILLVIIMAYNVIGRYAFHSSSIGMEEFSWHLYAAIFLLGIPYGLRHGSHVRVDLVYESLSKKTRAFIDMAGSLIFLLPFCLTVIWGGWLFTAEAWGLGNHADTLPGLIAQIFTEGVGEKSQDPGGLLNRWIIKGVIPLSFFLLLLSGLAFFIGKLRSFTEEVSTADTGDSL